MKSIYLLCKKLKSIPTLLGALFLLFSTNIAHAQAIIPTVDVNLSIAPPYSPFYSDYSGQNASKVFLTLVNKTLTPKTVKLFGYLTGDNGIRLSTRSNYTPLQPIHLGPNESKQLNGTALLDIFDVNSLNVYGIDKSRIVYTSRLPEGNYDLCIKVVDMATNQILSESAPLGCTSIRIAYPEPPILLGPVDNGHVTKLDPQNVLYAWANAGFVPLNTQYTLQVAEMPDIAANPNQVLDATSFPVINKTLAPGNFIYTSTLADPPLKLNKRYAWRVRSFDPTGQTVFKNDGISGAYTFTYTAPEVLLAAPVITIPQNNMVITQAKDMNGFPLQPKFTIKWNGAAPNAGTVLYTVKISKLNKDMNAGQALDNNAQVVADYTIGSTSFDVEAPDVTDMFKAQNTKGKRTVKLDTGAYYAIRITAKNADNGWLKFENMGNSNVVIFRYNPLPQAPVIAVPIEAPTYSTINGKLFYRFKNLYEKPVSTPFAFPVPEIMKQIGTPPLSYNVVMPNNAPYPDYICNNRFKKDDNTRPLKNVKIYLRYNIMQGGDSPKTYEDLKEVQSGNIDFYQGYTLTLDDKKYKYNILVKDATTQPDGSFSLNFLNDNKLGYLGYNKATGTSYYGVMQVVIYSDHNYYCSPEVIMFPKTGEVMTLPDEIVFANTYNLDVAVNADSKKQDQVVGKGTGLDNYPVQVLDVYQTWQVTGEGQVIKNVDMKDDPESLPVEGNVTNYESTPAMFYQQPVPLVDFTRSDKDGVAHFKNLLPGHTHMALAPENPLEGNYTYQAKGVNIKNWGKDINGKDYSTSEGFTSGKSWVFNTDFKVTQAFATLELQPKKPEIYLRAITIQNGVPKGLAWATVTITEYPDNSIWSFLSATKKTYYTDVNGYLQLPDLDITTEQQGKDLKVIGPLRTIVISKTGYADKVVATKQQLSWGERFPEAVEQEMHGSGTIVGYVVNEKGEPVMSNVRVGNGPYIKTASNGWYYIDNCEAGANAYVQIQPTVDNYFGESFTFNIKGDGDATLITNVPGNTSGRVVVKEKLHRVQFKIVDENNQPVKQSYVGVVSNKPDYYFSDPVTGITRDFALASPDDEFRVRVVADGYVIWDDYMTIPIRKTAVIRTITLIKGQTISGYVRDVKTKSPIQGARVYSVSGTNADGEIQNEATTDASGHYILRGVINAGMYMAMVNAYLQLPVKVYAVKSGSKAYIRQEKSVQGLNGAGNADFDLTALNAKAQIWGLDVEINELPHVVNANRVKLSGAFVRIPSNNNFKTTIENARLPFKDVEVTMGKDELGGLVPTYVGSEGTIKPVNNSIELETSAFKVMAFDKYSCEVLGTNIEHANQKLSIFNENGNGTLKGWVTSQLESFNFSYNYTGKFQLNKNIRTPGQGPQPLPVFGANGSYYNAEKFMVLPLYNKSSFNIHNFNAKLSQSGSTFSKDGFVLSADINMQIPLVGVNTLPAGKIKVADNNIVWEEYDGAINLPLEKWAIKGNGLRYDANYGGFRVVDGILQTELPNIPLKDLLIFPTTIDPGVNKLTGKENITVGNVTPLNLAPGAKMTLTFDSAVPFDQKPHYRLNYTNGDFPVAYISGLPAMDSYDRINVNVLSAYSDGIHRSVILDQEKHQYYNVISQTISNIDIGQDYFTLVGNTDIGIPGANNNVTGRFKFYKNPIDPKADPTTGIVCEVQKLQTDLEMPGKVKFNGLKFELSKNLLKVTGDVLIYKNTISDAIPALQGIITKNPGTTSMVIPAGQAIAMGGSSKKMSIVHGGNAVSGSSWDLLKFTAKPIGFDTKDNAGISKSVLVPGSDEIDFLVNGALSKDPVSKKAIQLAGIETPFGDLALTLDFDKKILQGSLKLVGAGIPLGPVTINDGTIDMQIDSKGFIVAGAITNASITPLPILKDIKSGIALGFYDGALPQYMTNNLLGVTLYNELPGLNDGLKGFYVNVMKSLTKADLPQLPGPNLKSIPLLGSFVPTFDFSAGIDLRTSMNIQNGLSVIIGGKAFAQASCLYDLSLCTIGLSGGADGEFQLKYADKELSGYLLFGVHAKIIYCVGETGVGIILKMEKNESGFKFKPSLN